MVNGFVLKFTTRDFFLFVLYDDGNKNGAAKWYVSTISYVFNGKYSSFLNHRK